MTGDRIPTSDQRLHVFISAAATELMAERDAVRDAVERLRLHPVTVELAGHRGPSHERSRSYLAQSDVFIGIYGERYDEIPPGGTVTGMEGELDLAGDLPRLLYVKDPVPARDERLAALINRIEQGEVPASYRTFTTAEELGELVVNDLALLLSERFSPDGPAARFVPRTLPAPAGVFVGRQDDVQAVARLLRHDTARLVTLIGPGGIGKTRLALEVARHLEDTFPGGMIFVPLAAVGDPDLVVAAIADAMGIRREAGQAASEAIRATIGEQPTLLILDNFEQVIDAAPELVAILSQTPSAAALVTSRHVLQVRMERQYQVAPLPEPEGVRLFVERASAVRPGFELTDANRAAVAEICRRLDGLPLAIELAAARARLLPPPLLLARLSERLDVLTHGAVDLPERQRTLRATMDWSYNLLTRHERLVFDRLAVFVGGWTLDAAESICGRSGEPSLLDTLSGLLASSLIVDADVGDEEPRFSMLETVRTYALDRLAESPDRRETQRRHTEWMLGVVAGRLQVEGKQHQVWLERFARERGNLRSAMRRALEAGDLDVVALLARDAFVPMAHRDAEAEVIEWLDEALESGATEAHVRGRLLVVRALAATVFGDYELARSLLREGRLLLPSDAAHAYDHALAASAEVYAAMAEDPTRAVPLADETCSRLAALGERLGQAYMTVAAGHLALLSEDLQTAEQRYATVIDLAEDLGDEAMRGRAQSLFALMLLARGDVDAGRTSVIEGAGANRRGGQPTSIAYSLDGLAAVALASGRAAAASRALAAAAVIRRRAGNPVAPPLVPLLEDLVTRCREALGDDAYEAQVAAAEKWGAVEAVDRTLEGLLDTDREMS